MVTLGGAKSCDEAALDYVATRWVLQYTVKAVMSWLAVSLSFGTRGCDCYRRNKADEATVRDSNGRGSRCET